MSIFGRCGIETRRGKIEHPDEGLNISYRVKKPLTTRLSKTRAAGAARKRPLPRPTQQQRRDATRRKLLGAAVRCIADFGYHGATMDLIVARAGLSRGAQMHHFPTKLDFAIATYDYLLGNLTDQLREQTQNILQGKGEPADLFKYLWRNYYSGDLFVVCMELALLSRLQPSLQSRLMEITDRFHLSVDESWNVLCRGKNIDEARNVRVLNLTMSLLRGLAVQTTLWQHPDELNDQLEAWTALVDL